MFCNVGIVLTGVQYWVFCNVVIVLTGCNAGCSVMWVLFSLGLQCLEFCNVGIMLTGGAILGVL